MKTKIGAENCLYPMPTVLLGALVDGRPNYATVAYVGVIDGHSLSLSLQKDDYTISGIKQTQSFSVNLPNLQLVKETDYCGLVSGRDVNKAGLFKTFYGELQTAPMIEDCPLNMETRLVKIVDFPQHEVFIGEIIQTYCENRCLTRGRVDFRKLHPILFTMADRGYWRLGKRFQNAWRAGEKIHAESRRNGD